MNRNSFLFIVFLVAISILGAIIYLNRLNSLTSNFANDKLENVRSSALSQTHTKEPSASPMPLESSKCNCSWAISSGTNVEILVTSPSGQQTGYLQASNSYVNNIPDASYGPEFGIQDPSGQITPMPNINYFGMNNPENGVYKLQVIGISAENYQLDISFAWEPLNSKITAIDGTLSVNQIDKYTITFPDGNIQKEDF